VSQVGLQRPGIDAIFCQLVAAGMAQHVKRTSAVPWRSPWPATWSCSSSVSVERRSSARPLALQSADDKFGALHDWINEHLASDLSLSVLAKIAQRCGFGSEEMRPSFSRLLVTTPQDYRARFGT
jgi:hypothetical protein